VSPIVPQFSTMKLVASEKAFEIKVAFIGLKNSGKSTLINALLKDKYAPVGIGGATTSVNSFRIFTKENPPDEAETQNDDAVSMLSFNSITSVEENSGSVWTVVPENLRTAAEIQNMISAAEIANIISEHRISHPTSHEIQELTFDVELPEGLCEMRADTNLTLIDIPGIGNIDSECKSLSYLVRKSHTFDCVVFVFDALQPIKKQASLLNFVKTILTAQISVVPVIVVFNKVDDGNNPDIATIELEALRLSQQEFGKLFKSTLKISLWAFLKH
jgi:GTPase SAR1 family protein